jgi:peptidoglycan/xylan/chitin deacetylase (PgdA/CDA1 family)
VGSIRRLRVFVVAVAVAAALLAPATASAATTIVSLTFDDALPSQYAVGSVLASNGMRATFYVNSNLVGTGSHLTWGQLAGLRAEGHEVGGHTLDHVDLLEVDSAEAQRQVCDDRAALLAHGFPVTSFAYPYGSRDAAVKAIVQGCGYNSGRRSWGLRDYTCSICLPAETIPVRDAYSIRTPTSVKVDDSLETIKGYVTQAEDAGGGWVPLVFHHICDGCDTYSISEAKLLALLDWLKAREANGTIVRTMHEVIGGPLQSSPDTTAPQTSIACNGSACSTTAYGSSVSVTLNTTDAGGSGVASVRYTVDGSEPNAGSTLYSGAFTVDTTTTVQFRAWDGAGNVESTKTTTIAVAPAPPTDTTAPTSTVTCDDALCSTGWYGAPVRVTLAATDDTGVTAIRYTLDGSEPNAGSTLYSGPFTVSSTTTVKFRAWDSAGNVEATKTVTIRIDNLAPTVTLTSPTNGAIVTKPVTVTAAAADGGSGVVHVVFYLDGAVLGTSSSSPYKISWNPKKSSKGQHTLWAVATDAAGNTTTSLQVAVTVG